MAGGVERVQERLRAGILSARERGEALAYLRRSPWRNLLLIELAATVGAPGAPSELPSQVLGAWRGDALVGLVSVRPSLVLDAELEPDVLEAFLPRLEALDTGLVKSSEPVVSALWTRLAAQGRRALIDRIETAYALEPGAAALPGIPAQGDLVARPARERDLEALVVAARASLREENRPDPFEGDPAGFQRWVRGRLHRARVIESRGRVAFVGYADVRRPEGWLIQGVYTWPEQRRRGMAAAGMAALVREAFAAGAAHVQLAVVNGNTPAERLYQGLGFEPFDTVRTILFAR
ncbi:MAG: GNAT family N-acetyltransferase [Proteobacteria bacterium]|nr:GNAT family N-acetyltransferase [Pseudomonadota bacterium]